MAAKPARHKSTRRLRARRYPEGTVSTTMRLRRSVRERLETWATRGRRSVSDVAQELIEEGIRMRECPGIYFASEPTGRTAKIAGTGLAVWEVLRDYVGDQDLERLHHAFSQLSRSQITAAMMYYRRHSEEVGREVEANAALSPELIAERHPGLVHVVPLG